MTAPGKARRSKRGLIGPTRILAATLAVVLLLPILAIVSPKAHAATGIDVSTIQSKDQLINELKPGNPITQAVFHPSGASGNSSTPYISYKYDKNSPALNFPLTSMVNYVATDSGGNQFNEWIFDLPAANSKTVGFFVHSETGTSDSISLFFAPGDPASNKGTAQNIESYSVDSVDKGPFGSYNPPLFDNSHTPDESTQQAKSLGITAIYTVKGGEINAIAPAIGNAIGDPLQAAFQSVSDLINKLLNGIITRYTSLLNSLLTPNSYLDFFAPNSAASSIKSIWASIRSTVDILFILVLIVIAFMNVLRIQVEYYAIRALLPRFVVAVILVNFSMIISQVILDATAVLTNSIFSAAPQVSLSNIAALVGAAGVTDIVFFNSFILLTIALGVFTVAAVLVARIAFIWFLVCISPISYLLMVLPITRGLHKWWWDNFITMVLIAPLMSVALLIAADISQPGLFNNSPGGTFLQIALVVALLFVAALLPAIIGGRVLSFIGASIASRHAGFRKTRLERSMGAQALSQRAERLDQRASIGGAKLLDAVGTASFGLAGTQGQRRRIEGAQIKKWKDSDSFLDWQELESQALNGRTDAERRSAALLIAERDLFGLPGSKLGSNATEAMHTLRAHVSDDGMADVFKEQSKKSFMYFNDPSIRAMQIDLADKRVLMAPTYGRGKDPIQELSIRLNAEKIADLSKGTLTELRNSTYAANINLSMHDLSQMSPRSLNEIATEDVRRALASRMEMVIKDQTSSGISYNQALESFSDMVANRVRNVHLNEAFYQILDKQGFTSFGSMTVRNVARMSPQWTNITRRGDGKIPPPIHRTNPET